MTTPKSPPPEPESTARPDGADDPSRSSASSDSLPESVTARRPPTVATVHNRKRLAARMNRWQKRRKRTWRKYTKWTKNIPAAMWLFLAFFGYFLWESILQPSLTNVNPLTVLRGGSMDFAAAQGFLNVQIRTLGVILAALFTLCAIAIPITSNNYTPKLVNLFINDVVNQLMFGLLVVSNLFANYTLFSMLGTSVPRVNLVIVALLSMCCIALTVPYAYYIFNFLQPEQIIQHIEAEILEDIDAAVETVDSTLLHELRSKVILDSKYLSNIILRSVDRHDRDTAMFGLESMRNIFDSYFCVKESMPPEWFKVSRADFMALSPKMWEQIEEGKTIFEAELLEELSLLYSMSLGKMNDIVRIISEMLHHIGLQGIQKNHRRTVELTYMYFNSFIRISLTQRLANTVYILAFYYRQLAERAMKTNPEDATRIAFFLDYYAHQAVRMGIVFIPNLLSYDVADLTILAFQTDCSCKYRLLEIYCDFERVAIMRDSPGVIKSHIKLATALHKMGFEEEKDQLCEALCHVRWELIANAFEEIESVETPDYWEITDRNQHLDYVLPEMRESFADIKRLLQTRHKSCGDPGPDERESL